MNNKIPYLSKTTYSLFKILHKCESMHDMRQIYLNHFKPAAQWVISLGYTTVSNKFVVASSPHFRKQDAHNAPLLQRLLHAGVHADVLPTLVFNASSTLVFKLVFSLFNASSSPRASCTQSASSLSPHAGILLTLAFTLSPRWCSLSLHACWLVLYCWIMLVLNTRLC